MIKCKFEYVNKRLLIMKKFIFVLIILTSSVVILSGQTIETVGAGVAEFLLSSPKTANKMNHDQQIALAL